MSCKPLRTRWRSLSNAFMAWLVQQNADVRAEIVATRRRHRVHIRFPRYPSLRGRVWNHCLAVYADDDRGENYDRIFDADCLPIHLEGSETFECGFCEGERAVFEDREALFKDHLFEPFGEWVCQKLRHATGVEYQRIGGVTWARLRTPESSDTFEEDDLRIDDGGVEHLRFYRRAALPRRIGTL